MDQKVEELVEQYLEGKIDTHQFNIATRKINVEYSIEQLALMKIWKKLSETKQDMKDLEENLMNPYY